jgi:hypothetical protein
MLEPETLDTLLREWIDELGEPPVLIIIDSLNTTAAPGSTLSNDDMGAYATVLRRMAEAWDACAGFINHPTWSESDRPRGASALVGDIDTVLSFQPEKKGAKTGTLKHYRDRLSKGEFALRYRVESVELSGHHAGRTAPVVVPDDGADVASAGRQDKTLTEAEQKLYSLFVGLVHQYTGNGGAVYYGTWRHAWVKAGGPAGSFSPLVGRLATKGKIERLVVDGLPSFLPTDPALLGLVEGSSEDGP